MSTNTHTLVELGDQSKQHDKNKSNELPEEKIDDVQNRLVEDNVKSHEDRDNDVELVTPYYTRFRFISLILGPLLCLIFSSISFSDENPKASSMFGCAAWICVWWLCQTTPIPVTSLLPVVILPLFDITSSKETCTAYFNWVQFLLIGAFIVDIGIERTNVHRRVALNVLLKFDIRPKFLLLGFMLVSWLFSMFCMNTSTTLMLIPFVLGVLQTAEKTAKNDAEVQGIQKFGRGVLLGVAYASSAGGVATLIGTAPNGVFAGSWEQQFPESGVSINFGTWSAWGFPISCLMFLPTWGLLVYMYCNVEISLTKDTLRDHLKKLGPLNRDEIAVAVVQTIQMFLWVIRGLVLEVFIGNCSTGESSKHACTGTWKSAMNSYDGGIACGCAMLLFLIPSQKHPNESILEWEYTSKHLPWGVVLLLGAGFSVANGFLKSGLSKVIVEQFADMNVPTFWLLFVVVYCVIILTELTSNTATSTILLPILGAVARSLNIHPMVAMAPVTVACSMAFMFPVATPPNAIVYATGRIPYNEMAKLGLILNVIAGVVILIATFSYGPSVWSASQNWAAPSWLNTRLNTTNSTREGL